MIQIILIMVALGMLYMVQMKFYARYWNEELEVSVKFQNPEIPEGQTGKLQVTIENNKKLPLPMLMVKFQTDRSLVFHKDKGSVTTDQFYHNDIFQVGAGERVIRTLSFYGNKRGYYRINNVDLTGADILMAARFHDSFQPSECIYVLPKPNNSDEFKFMLHQLNGEMITKRNLYEDPFELRGIREYQPFDDRKSINWKATAKTGQYMVNQKNYTSPKSVRIFLNLDDLNILKMEESLEESIRIAAGLVNHLMAQGIKVSLFCNALDIETDDPLIKSSGIGEQHKSAIMRGLARLDLKKTAKPFVPLFGKRVLVNSENTYTCFISSSHYAEYNDLLLQFSASGNQFNWFYPSTERFSIEEIPMVLRRNLKMIHIQ